MENLPQRKKIRLQGYDYSQNGAYFITICLQNRVNLFGEICYGKMELNEYGKIAFDEIGATNQLRRTADIEISKHVVMPNHVHMIVEIVGTRRAVSDNSKHEQFSGPTEQSIPTIIRAYKSAVTKRLHELDGHGTPCPYRIWQSRYYDHVIRSEQEYLKIWEYIDTNPMKWKEDCFYGNEIN